ncbi:hypothetical protein H3146_15245 [Streptomyces sp. OF3]|uniref:Transferase n=1 Tax=Streptomyces alkaliterrae TaxID=2213162 RepID=A0A5P0YWF6_9ACTN|nr:hypothetical protein [Streptomyces alkaliterrae]MBB1258025.1 hypothetical protein [Streptomyces alkaliterrae]MQS04614.1 hypothetical protein [Streptomyces alkaliterrae]
MTFDIALPEAAERWDAALLLHEDDPVEDAVRLPLVPSGPRLLRAVLPSTVPLGEGRWKVSLAVGEEPPRRVAPGRSDLRSLVARVPRTGRTWLGVRIPYRTRQGNLSLRAWQRWPHAEANELRVVENALTVRGRLYGATAGPGAALLARTDADGASATAAAEVPLASVGSEEFTALLPLRSLPVPEDDTEGGGWSLWLRPADGEEPVRIARILDDIPDKRRVIRYPAVPLADAPGALRPCYTADNDLAVRLER